MNFTKIAGIVLVAAGCLGLIYGGFSYTRETTGVQLGPIALKVEEKQSVTIPLVASVAAIVAGIFLLAFKNK